MGNKRSTKLDGAPADPMASIVGDIGPSIDSFRRHLRASNAAPRTVSTYLEGATQFATFLAAQGMPTPRPHPHRYRSRLAFYKSLLEEGEITQSPMASMQPPMVPEQPPRVLSEAEVRGLLKACDGPGYPERRAKALRLAYPDP